jgi:hypothetical protein
MGWYVFALVDERPRGRPGTGLGGGLSSRPIPGGFAIVEHRADIPPVEFGTLKQHDAVVARLAEAVPAILPVRFGTLLEPEEVEEALADREEEIAEAFALVRGRLQFTWRRASRRRSAKRPTAVPPRGAEPRAGEGAAYLRRAARLASPVPPAAFRGVREKLRPFVAAERYDGERAMLPESLYHLVDRGRAEGYRRVAAKLAAASSLVRLTGPFPPFAFAPELL